VYALVRAQFQLRYRQSFAGVWWAVLPPLATLGAATLVFHKVAGIDSGDTPYAVFTLAALVPWSFFATSLAQSIPSVAGSTPVVTRLSFPKAALPISQVGLSLLDMGVTAAIFLIFLFTTGERLPITALWFPVLLAVEIVLLVGVSLLGSALNVFARDIKVAVPVAIQLWLFITPVMYPLTSVPRSLRSFYLANPMTGVVESFRDTLVYGHGPRAELLVPSLIGAAVAFVLGWLYFADTEPRFADVI
jgi:ABC-type polysaccharide/polyol phosphate export permease